MAPFSYLYDDGCDDRMPPANGLWDPEDDINFSNPFIDALMAHASSGTYGFGAASIVPRGGAALEQIQEMSINLSRDSNNNTESQDLPSSTANPNTEDNQGEEPVNVTYPEASHLPKGPRNDFRPRSPEWGARKNEIKYWYIEKKSSCEETRKEMAKVDFHATVPMYKRRFKKWGWQKYGMQPLTQRAGRRPRRSLDYSLGTIQDANFNSSCSPSSAIAILTPSRANARIPTAVSEPKILGLCGAMLFNAKELYLSYLTLQKWNVAHERKVEEEIHDDLLVGVATSLQNYDSLGQSGLAISFKGMRQAFQVLERVVGVQKGADCGLFSLPAIWESYLRMIRKKKPDLAACFLEQAVQLAKQKFGKDHPFAQVLLILQMIQREDSQQLAEVIFSVYRSCIEHVENNLGSFHLTTLSLWGDFVVYLDGSSINQTRAAVNNVRRGIQKSETENGPDHAYTLELLGLTLYFLQSNPTMSGEAEVVALDMFQRVERIKANAGGKLEGDLLITWKDLKHTLGTLKRNQNDYVKAIEYLEEFLHDEIIDDRDNIALQKLEECYTSLGELERAEMVQKRHMMISQILLCQDEVKSPKDDKSRSTEDEPAESINGGCMVTNFETPNEKENKDKDNEEEDDDSTDEVGDVEIEKKLLREQISEWEQKLKALEKKGKKGKKEGKKERKSSA